MSLWTDWGENWLKRYREEESYLKQLDQAEKNIGPEAQNLANKYEQLESLTPNEDPNLIAAAADMNLSDSQYIELYKQTTNPVVYNENNRSSEVNNQVKQHYNWKLELMKKLTLTNFYLGTKEGKRRFGKKLGSYFFNGSTIFLESIIQGLDKSAIDYNTEYQAELESQLNKENKTLQDTISVAGYEKLKDNEMPVIPAIKAHTLATGRYFGGQLQKIFNRNSYYDPSVKAKQFLAARGLVDEEGNPVIAKTNLDVFQEIFPDLLSEKVEIRQKELGRELDFAEKTRLYIDTIDEIIDPETDVKGFAELLAQSPEFDEVRDVREDLASEGIPITIGDGLVFGATGNLSSSYGPGNAITEFIDEQFDNLEIQAQELLDQGRITGTEYYELLDEAETAKNNAIKDLGYQKEYSMAGFLAGGINVAKYIFLDILNYIIPGSGLAKRASKDLDEVFSSFPQQIKKGLDEGKTLREIYDENIETFKAMADMFIVAKENNKPIAVPLINQGFHPDFAFKVQAADTTADDILKAFEDGIENGYVADLFYGGRFLGRGKNKYLQTKVLQENRLEAIKNTDLDEGIVSNKIRGGGVRDQLLAQDIKLPPLETPDLDDIKGSMEYFTRYGALGKVPEGRLEELATEFYTAIKNGELMEAKRIFNDKLVKTEIGLQLKKLYGMTDSEVDEFFNKYYFTNEKMGFDDNMFKPMSPSRNPDFYDPTEVDIITEKMFSDVVSENDMIAATKQSLELFSQLKNLNIHGPDVIGLVRATSAKRRLRAKLLNTEGYEDIFEIVRKAADEGKDVEFWKEGTELNELLRDVLDDFPEPNKLFQRLESSTQSIDDFTFGYMKNAAYPGMLLFRANYPLKLAIDGQIKFKLFGLRTLFENPFEYFKLMLNDPDGMLAKAFGIKPDTLLTGPYRTAKEIQLLDGYLPPRLRQSLGMFSADTQQFGIPELGQIFATDIRFFDDRFITNSAHVLINKQSPQWGDAYVYFLYKYIDDDLAPIIAAMKRKEYTIEQMADVLQSEESILKIIDNINSSLIRRGPAQRTYEQGLIKTREDFVRVAQHLSQSLDNYTGGNKELLDIIADAKVGDINLRNIESVTGENSKKAASKIKRIADKYKDNLPYEIPLPKRTAEEALEPSATRRQRMYGGYRNLLNSLFFATSQGEGSLVRIPLIKQVYNLGVDSFSVFGTKDALQDMLKQHFDPDSSINLNKKVLKSVQKELERAEHTLKDYDEVLNKYIKPKVVQQTYKDVTSFIATVFTEQGQKSANYLAKTGRNADSIKFTTDIQEAESAVYGASNKIAEGRLGFDDSKVGTYVANFTKNEVIYNGNFFDNKIVKDVLQNTLDSGYGADDIDLIVKEAIEYLSTPGANKTGLENVLGLNNKYTNLDTLKIKFQNTVKKKTTPGRYTNIDTHDVGNTTIERILKKKIGIAIPKRMWDKNQEQLIDDVYEFVQNNKNGFSIDLGNPELWGKEAALFVSPYKTRSLVKSGKDSITKEVIEFFIRENQDLLRKTDHVLGGWFDPARNQFHLDVSVKINRGVKDTSVKASKDAYSRVKYLGLAGDQISFGETYLIKEGDEIVDTVFRYDDTNEIINNAATYNWLRTQGSKLLTDTQKKIFGDETIVRNPGYLKSRQGVEIAERALNANKIFEKMNIKGIFNRKEKTLEVFNPAKNSIMQNLNEWSYTQVLDMNDVRANIRRNMSFEDIHQRSVELAMEAMTNLLYNLTDRGYFAQAYRTFFTFFEAWREYTGRYALLSANNPKAPYQIAQGYRKGVENNVIMKDRFGDSYLFIPTEGTPLQAYNKSDGNGLYTEDVSDEDSRVYIKRSMPLGALGVGGNGFAPSLGLGSTIPLGILLKDKPRAKKAVENFLMAGYQLPFTEDQYDLKDIPGEFIEMAIPSVAKNWFNAIADNIGLEGIDEDIYLLSTTRALQIAAQLHPELASDTEALQAKAAVIRDNIYLLQAWDRFISPFAPKLNVLYKIEGNQTNFEEWYDKEGYEAGIFYNNMVELAAIHGFYQDMRKQWSSILGPSQGDYYALMEVVRLLGLDKYDLQTQFTSAGMQVKGKTVQQAGRIARTTEEYDFVLSHPELAKKYGPVFTYFSKNLDEGVIDFSGYQSIKSLGLVTPKTEEQFLLDVQTYLASIVQRAMKDDKLTSLESTGLTDDAIIKAENARIDAAVRKMFPAAMGDSEAYNLLLGGETAERIDNTIMVDFLLRAAQDSEMEQFELTQYLQEYFAERQAAINAVKTSEGYPDDKGAMNWITTSSSAKAQDVRLALYTKGYEIIDKYPLFMVVFDEVLVNEIDRFGVEE